MARIEDAVNVGTRLAAELRGLGIETIESLREVGAQSAWDKLFAAGLRDDASTRIALEGAVRGVRWKEVSPDERLQLTEEVARRVEAGTSAPDVETLAPMDALRPAAS